MITLFTTAKAFRADPEAPERLALSSWRRLLPRCEIVLFGDRPGAAEAARAVGALHVADVQTSAEGLPLLSDMILRAEAIARHDLLGFARADMIFLANLTEQVTKHRAGFGGDFLLAGRYWSLRLEHPIDLDGNWEPPLRWQVSRRGRMSGDRDLGYCLWPRGRRWRLPAFSADRPDAAGRMVAACIEAGGRVIDGSRAITAVRPLRGRDPVLDRAIPDGDGRPRHDLRSAGWALTSNGLVANRRVARSWTTWLGRPGAVPGSAGTGDRPDRSGVSNAPAPKPDRAHQAPATTLPAGGELLVSVVICTYNRADLLGACLESLLCQDAGGFEIIVVDNNSTDTTREVALRFADRGVPLRHVFEADQGLSPARNRGWREARGLYVAYVDDECRMPEDWIRNMAALIDAQAPEMLGGPYDACFDGPQPAWYRRPYFSTVWKGVALRPVGPSEFLAGGNMAIRRELFDRIGPFDPELGMKGGAIAYGEETAFQRRLMKRMPEARRLFDPALSVDHLVREGKLGVRELVRQRIAAGQSGWRMAVLLDEAGPKDAVQTNALWRDLVRTAAKLAWHLLIGLPLRKRALYPYAQNYLREVVGLSATRLGRLLAQRRDLKQRVTAGR